MTDQDRLSKKSVFAKVSVILYNEIVYWLISCQDRCSRVKSFSTEKTSGDSLSQNVPKHEQKTVRVAVIGRTNSGKSSLINEIFGREVCPVGDEENLTRINQIHSIIRGDTLFEFVDVPGVPGWVL